MPTNKDYHVDAVLSNFAVGYNQDEANFAFGKVCSQVNVNKESGRYYTFKKGAWLRDQAKRRAPGSEAALADYELDNTPTYNTENWTLARNVPEEEVLNSDSVLNPFVDTTKFLTQQLLIRGDRLFAEAALTGSSWDTFYSGQGGGPMSGSTWFTQWDLSTSNPILDVNRAQKAVRSSCGAEPRTLFMTDDVYQAVRNNAKVESRISHFKTNVKGMDLAEMFDVDEVIVGKSVFNSAHEGAADSVADISTNCALLLYRNPAGSLYVPTALRMFSFNGIPGGAFGGQGTPNIQVRRMDDVLASSTRIQVNLPIDIKVVAKDAGLFFYNVLSNP